MSAKPRWHSSCAAGDERVEANPSGGAKISSDLRLALDFADIKLMDIGAIALKSPPGVEGVSGVGNLERTGEIVAAAQGNDKNRFFAFDELRKIAMKGAIAPEDQDSVGTFKIRGRG